MCGNHFQRVVLGCCLGDFQKKEDNLDNVTIIIFVAKTHTLPACGAETFLLSFKGGGNYPLCSIFKECSSYVIGCLLMLLLTVSS